MKKNCHCSQIQAAQKIKHNSNPKRNDADPIKMCPNNMKIVTRIEPYGLIVLGPQLSDDEGSTEAVHFPRKVMSTQPPALDNNAWMGMNLDFALDRNDEYEVAQVECKPVPVRNNAATPPPPMEDDVWMAMNQDFACDWREEECVKQIKMVTPKQIQEPIEYGDYTMWGI